MKMLVTANDVIGSGLPFHNMANLRQHGPIEIHNYAAQTVRAPDFLNRRSGDNEAVLRNGKQDDLLSRASVTRYQTRMRRLRHRDPIGCVGREMDSTYFS